jgi:hypothetical protein
LSDTSDKHRKTSLIEGDDGNTHLSHYEGNDADLRYCEGKEEDRTCQIIDSTGQVGASLSLVEGNDANLHISHYDNTNDDLRYCEGMFIILPYEPPQSETPAFCGDNSCDFASRGETAVTCPADCSAVCGDTACTHTESPETCALDCIGCGDAKCGVEEDCSNCETDCGVCKAEPPAEEPPVEPPVNKPVEPGVGEPSNESSNGTNVQEQPVECMIDSDCANTNPCTTKTCVGTVCHTVPKADGSSCGFAQECISLTCTQMSIIPTIPEVDTTTQLAVIAAAALVVGTAYIYLHSIV